MEQPTVLKFSGSSGRAIFFEPGNIMPQKFIEAKKYMNSVFLENGSFEFYAFSLQNVDIASEEETDMYVQLKDRSVHLIGKT